MGEGRDQDVAIVLPSSATVVGFFFDSVGASGGQQWVGSPPIAGKVRLKHFWWANRTPSANTNDWSMQLAISHRSPWNQVEIDGAEQVFPYASTKAGQKSRISWFVGYACTPIPCGLILPMNGRRLVCGVTNGSVSNADCYVGTMLERVEGGESSGGVQLLRGERVKEG